MSISYFFCSNPKSFIEKILEENEKNTNISKEEINGQTFGRLHRSGLFIDIMRKRRNLKKENEIGENWNISNSNFEEMTSNVNCEEMKNKTLPLYSLRDLENTYSFKMEDIINQKSEYYIFDINLNGKLNKELSKNTIDAKLELKGITDRKAD